MPSGAVIRYAYDNKNNITHVYENDVLKIRYTYDAIGQLTREDNAYVNRTYTYAYDTNGNISHSYTYGTCLFDAIDHSLVTGLKGYGYADAEWGDLLTSFNGVQFTYDAIGNPLSYYNGKNYSMTWQNGRQLSSVTKDGVTTSYGYNADGIRTSKTVNGTTTYFVIDGDRIIFEGNTTEYYYDESGAPVGIKYNGYIYYFIKNLQGDVVAIYDNTGTCVVEYLYDAWGKVLSITGSKADTLGVANPFRYRGYYYDNETGFYYLQSRYYDPSIGRFISPDTTDILTATPMAITDKNLFAYCDNNPVVRIDTGGQFWDIVFDAVSLVVSIVDVVQNPDDLMAWAGLAADIISLAIPGLTGGGAMVKAISKVDDVVDTVKTIDKVDYAIDTTKTVRQINTSKTGWRVGDEITNLTKAGNTPSWSTVRQRYWKNEAYYHPELYPDDLDRLKKGLAPIGEDGFSMELHHPLGRDGNNFFIFEPLTQTQHRLIHYGD